jgi:Uma2 family endonuclease
MAARVEARGLGIVLTAPLDVILADTTILQPDIIHLDRERLPALQRHGVDGSPTLVVEIVSPGTAPADHGAKRQLYARHAIPYFWLVDPAARVVEALVLRGSAYEVALTATGSEPIDVPPFTDLRLAPSSLWP